MQMKENIYKQIKRKSVYTFRFECHIDFQSQLKKECKKFIKNSFDSIEYESQSNVYTVGTASYEFKTILSSANISKETIEKSFNLLQNSVAPHLLIEVEIEGYQKEVFHSASHLELHTEGYQHFHTSKYGIDEVEGELMCLSKAFVDADTLLYYYPFLEDKPQKELKLKKYYNKYPDLKPVTNTERKMVLDKLKKQRDILQELID